MTTTTPHINRSLHRLAVTAASVLLASSASPAASTGAGSPLAAVRDATPQLQVLKAPSDTPNGVRSVTITYRSHTGSKRHAVVLFPASYRLSAGHLLPLVISPHGRGRNGATNARLWGNLPALGNFAVVNPDGQGNKLAALSWGAEGQIDDLARMPRIVEQALPLRIDHNRVYAIGGSMGGQEVLLLAGRHPSLLAGVVAVDPVVDFGHQYAQYPRLRCLGSCKKAYGNLGRALQSMARRETGGTPTSAPAAYAARSPLTYVKTLAGLRVQVQVWWSIKDRIVVDSDTAQAGRLVREARRIDPNNTLVGIKGTWVHTGVLRASRDLPTALAGLGLMDCRYASDSAGLDVAAGSRPVCWTQAAMQV